VTHVETQMNTVYRSKADWWVGLIIGVAVVVIIFSDVALLLRPPPDGLAAVWIPLDRS